MRAVLVAVLVLAGCFGPSGQDAARPPAEDPPAGPVRLALVVEGLDMPVGFVDAGGDRFLAVEQTGRVKVVEDGRVTDTFLDVSAEISAGGERGLLGLALSPDFATDGLVFVSTTDRGGDTWLGRYRVGADGLVDPATRVTILTVGQPFGNHNGGNIVFGPDRMLWFGLGDGGSAGDPANRAQDTHDLLGKLLRLDVLGKATYEVPPDNPFVDGRGRGEVWAYGLRNPWRFSFDRATGDLWIGDVGQNAVEEVDHAPAADGRGKGANYGWRVWEGTRRFLPGTAEGAVFPVAEYAHEATGGCSVTGGHVYRGPSAPALVGRYIFADYCTGDVWTLHRDGEWRVEPLLKSGRVSSFAEDRAGDVYVVDHGGKVLKLVQGEG